MPTTFQINLFLSQGKNEPNTKKQFWNVMKRCLKTALCKSAEDLASRDLHPCPVASLFSLSSQLVLLPQTKESIAPRTLHHHSKAFVCLQWPLKSRSQILHSCFLLLFKKKRKKESFSDAKGKDQWGPGLMVTKRPEGWPSFQHHGLWVFQAMDKHYGLSVVKMVNLIKEVTPQHLSVFLRITPYLLESLRQPTGIPRVSWSCCFVLAQRQWHPRQCCGLGIPIWILLNECFRVTGDSTLLGSEVDLSCLSRFWCVVRFPIGKLSYSWGGERSPTWCLPCWVPRVCYVFFMPG